MPTAAFSRAYTLGQREAIEEEHEAEQSGNEELHVGVLELVGILGQGERERAVFPYGTVDKPHGDDEAHGAQHADGREVGNGVEATALQDGEGGGVGQRNGGHEEGHAERVHSDECRLVGQLVAEACLKSHPPAAQHEAARRQQMAEAEHALRLHV